MLSPRNENKLRTAWFGPKTFAQLAKQFDLEPDSVRKFWQREKAAGRLPSNQPRPHFREATTVLCAAPLSPPQSDIIDRDLDAEIEQSEITAQSADVMNVSASDASLAALRAAHGDDPKHFHTMPSEWLLAESDSFMRSANEFAAHRIIMSLKKYLPHRDAMMSAFMKKQAARLAGKVVPA